MILAGGLGTRLQEETVVRPKPMVEIGGEPILWHIMKGYSSQGFDDFVIALGYKGEYIKEYFLNYYHLRNSISITLRDGRVQVQDIHRDHWRVQLTDTGAETQTGGRMKRLREFVGNETFMMTYGDGVSNVNPKELLAFHRKHGKLATVTAVRPPARFGGLVFNGDMVTKFEEKPHTGEGWINGGFFVLEPGVMDYIEGDDTHFEREPLERLASDGQLVAYRHEGFWHAMDTLRDVRQLDEMWKSGKADWKVWKDDD